MKDRTLTDGKRGVALAVRITPRASQNEIVAVLSDQTVKIRLTSSPSEEDTNRELIQFLSEILDIPKHKIEVVAGQAYRDKLVSILDVENSFVHNRILSKMA